MEAASRVSSQSINPRGILELTLANETLAILVRLRPVTEQLEARATRLPPFDLYFLDCTTAEPRPLLLSRTP
ncbi:hypothetical protein H9Q74_005198 [Fusarium xylarioides]|nr:hypothetical protein H9Q71_009658 [Fusarium xylarioides]KAG5824707.1 hypothetical protein H9Q74_005198 [Fusarium xylarioides]